MVLRSRNLARKDAYQLLLLTVVMVTGLVAVPVWAQDVIGPLTEANQLRAILLVQDQQIDAIERTSRAAAEAMSDRFVRDLAMEDGQAEVFRLLLSDYIDATIEVRRDCAEAVRRWVNDAIDRSTAQRPVGDVDAQRPPPLDGSDDGVHRVEKTIGPDGRVEYHITRIRDESTMVASRRAMAAIVREVLFPRQIELERTLHDDLQSLLTDEQSDLFERAVRRLTISMRDGIYPRSGSYPDWYLDMLGLLDEACEPENELHLLAEALSLQPIEHADGVNALQREAMRSMRSALEQFEAAYETVLLQHEQAGRDFESAMANERGNGASDGRQRSVAAKNAAETNGWALRRALMLEIEAIAQHALGDEAAARWRQRYYERVCPRVYVEDEVDQLAEQLLPSAEQESERNSDRVAAYREVINRYAEERATLRERLCEAHIERSVADRDERARAIQRTEELDQQIRQLRDRTMKLLQQLRASEPLSNDSSGGQQDDQTS